MPPSPEPDQLTDGGQTYFYREGRWTTGAGMCLSTTEAAALSMKFFQQHGRSPLKPDPPRRKRAVRAATPKRRKAEAAKTEALRSAIARALAKSSSR